MCSDKIKMSPVLILLCHHHQSVLCLCGFSPPLWGSGVWCDAASQPEGRGAAGPVLLHRSPPPQSMWPCDHTHCNQNLWPKQQERREAARRDKTCNTAAAHTLLRQPPHPPPDNMDCGIFTSKTVLLFLSLVFWVRARCYFLHLHWFEFIFRGSLGRIHILVYIGSILNS